MFRILSATFVLWVCLRGTALADVLYTVEELLPLPGFTRAHAYSLNDSGQVVGYSWVQDPIFLSQKGALAAMFWYQGSALALTPPSADHGLITMDINKSGYIVGQSAGGGPFEIPDNTTGFAGGSGQANAEWPQVGSPLITTGVKCALQDEWTTTITDSGYRLVTGFGDQGAGGSPGLVSPNGGVLCGVDVLELYETGVAKTPEGLVYDPLVDGVHEWVTVSDCTNATGVAAEVCALADGELHNKLENASGQRIVNIGDRAFLLTPCSPFPGGGSTEGCFPGNGPFPGLPEPGTLALLAVALAGLGLSRARNTLQHLA